MRFLKKALVTAMAALFMVFHVAAIAGAVTYKDGTYNVEESGGQINYKLRVVVSGGKITEAHVGVFYGETELSEEAAASNESLQKIFNSFDDYSSQLVSTNDGSAINKGADEAGVYDAFMAMVDKFEAQALEGADDNTDNTTDDVPKTGVVGLSLVYGLGALITGAYSLKRKK